MKKEVPPETLVDIYFNYFISRQMVDLLSPHNPPDDPLLKQHKEAVQGIEEGFPQFKVVYDRMRDGDKL